LVQEINLKHAWCWKRIDKKVNNTSRQYGYAAGDIKEASNIFGGKRHNLLWRGRCKFEMCFQIRCKLGECEDDPCISPLEFEQIGNYATEHKIPKDLIGIQQVKIISNTNYSGNNLPQKLVMDRRTNVVVDSSKITRHVNATEYTEKHFGTIDEIVNNFKEEQK